MPLFSVGTPHCCTTEWIIETLPGAYGHTDATHIFDGLDTFPTHVAHMRDGAFVTPPSLWNPKEPIQADSQASTRSAGSNLHALALSWLREDRELRLAEEESGKRAVRGPKASDVSHKSGVGVLLC